jgi:hypothetical protein
MGRWHLKRQNLVAKELDLAGFRDQQRVLGTEASTLRDRLLGEVSGDKYQC